MSCSAGQRRRCAPKHMLAYEGKGEFCAGEWCRFCKARYTCRKRSEYHMRLAERDFKQPDLLSDEEIADILPVAESLNSWVQDLMAYATQEAVDGKRWPGYKLVAGRTVRKYTSEAEVIKAATEAGYTDIYKTTLSGRWRSGKAPGQKEVQRGAGQVRRQAPGRADACSRNRSPQAVFRCGGRFQGINLNSDYKNICTVHQLNALSGRKEKHYVHQSHHRQGSRVLRSRFRAPEHQRQRTQVQLLPHHPQERYRDGRKDQGSH